MYGISKENHNNKAEHKYFIMLPNTMSCPNSLEHNQSLNIYMYVQVH